MRKSLFTEEQIVLTLRNAEYTTPVDENLWRLGATETIFYHWKNRSGSLRMAELRELRQLLDEYRRLDVAVSDFTLDKTTLHEALQEKGEASGPIARSLDLLEPCRPRLQPARKPLRQPVYRSLQRYAPTGVLIATLDYWLGRSANDN